MTMGTVSLPARPPGMVDVARLAKVSHQTVSRVLNDPDAVRPATRERVQAAIESLGYRRNSAARALVTGRSQSIGIVSFNATLYGPASTIDGIEKAASEAGYFVSVAAIHDLGQRAVSQAVERLLAQAVDGVMVVAPFPLTVPDRIPAVMLHGGSKAGMPSVSVDQELGARLATEHLLGQGHRTVFHVAGDEKWTESRRRVSGWKAALRDAGAPVPCAVAGRLECAVRLRSGTAARDAARGDRDLRRERSHGSRSASGHGRGRQASARGRQRRWLRRHPRGGVPAAHAQLGPAGLRRGGPTQRRADARADRARWPPAGTSHRAAATGCPTVVGPTLDLSEHTMSNDRYVVGVDYGTLSGRAARRTGLRRRGARHRRP